MQVYILMKDGKVEGVFSSSENAEKAALENFDINQKCEILVYTMDN